MMSGCSRLRYHLRKANERVSRCFPKIHSINEYAQRSDRHERWIRNTLDGTSEDTERQE